jgi:hypothetical protein
VTAQSITQDGAPVFPVSGEVHFSRLARERWDPMLRAAAAGGLTHVSSYVFWNHHEASRGELRFDGHRDLRGFAERAAGHGLGFIARIGPYVHAESRHGGLPDWLVQWGVPLRTNDPRYLAEVERWYAALAREMRGIELFSVQVDNELYDRPEHLTELRRIAESHGLSAPLWTATAWGGAAVPEGFLPSYGGYPESFWVDADAGNDARSAANFYPTPRRDDDTIGADHRTVAATESARPPHPFATCELGSGMASAYHRRLDVPAGDVEAIALAKLASGSVWQGYYMYADGRNPAPGLQESQGTGAPNDFPDLSYDFGAPVSLDGAPRESWFRLRRQHLLLKGWGSALAAMPPSFPGNAVDAPDVEGLRWSVRTDGRRGFVFVVNRHPGVALPGHPGVRFDVELAERTVTFPPVDIPSGAVFAWPFGLRVGDVELAWMTAQPITQLWWRDAPLLVATATPGVAPALEADADVAPVDHAGPGTWFALTRGGWVVARILVLDETDALAASVVSDELVLAPGAIVDGAGVLFAVDAAQAPVARVLAADGWRSLDVRVEEPAPLTWTIEREAGAAPQPASGASGRASVPVDWSEAAVVRMPVDPADGRTVALRWRGDAARAWDGDRLVSDALWNGRPWRIPAEDRGAATDLRLEILPLPSGAPIHFPHPAPRGAGVDAAEYEPAVIVPWPSS